MLADSVIEERDRRCLGHNDTQLSGAGDVDVDVLDDILREFLVESYENLDQLDQDLIAVEDIPDDRDCRASVFRTVHTIKGTPGFPTLPKLERVAHVGVNLLVPPRVGKLDLSRDIADGLPAMVDAIREILGNIETSGGEGDGKYEALARRFGQLLDTETPAVAGEAPAGTSLSEEELSDVVSTKQSAPETSDAETADEKTPGQKITTTRRESGRKKAQAEEDSAPEAAGESPEVAAESPPPKSVPKKSEAATAEKEAAASESPKSSSSIADQTVRIDVDPIGFEITNRARPVAAENPALTHSTWHN